VLLVTFNWPENSERYRRTAKFVDAFFSKIDEFLKPPRHPKWAESSINVKIPGWERFEAADDWIAQHVGRESATKESSELFKRFLTQNHIDNVVTEDSAALFRQFLERKEKQPSAR
jgi:arginyl-tRNA--protein-N-Asp/Glu arginylyltransferase